MRTHCCFVAGLPTASSVLAAPARRTSSQSSLARRMRVPTRAGRADVSIMCAASSDISDQFKSEDSLDRIRAINRVDELPTMAEQVHNLVTLTENDDNPQVRYAAISRLSNLDPAQLSPADAATVLSAARKALTSDKEPSCQAGAADLIAGLKLSDGFDDLVHTFNTTSDWMLKFSIAAGLGEMGDPRAFDFLAGILGSPADQEFLVIAGAIGSMGELGDERALPIVSEFLDHEDPSIKDRASIACDRLKGTAS